MGAYVKEHCLDIDRCGRNCHFQAGKGFLVEASPMAFRPLLEGGMDRRWNTFKCYGFHSATIPQPLWLSMAGIVVFMRDLMAEAG